MDVLIPIIADLALDLGAHMASTISTDGWHFMVNNLVVWEASRDHIA